MAREEVLSEVAEQQPEVKGGPGQPECVKPFGEDSLETRKQISLYRGLFQTKQYLEALPYWRYVFQNAPCAAEYVTADGIYLMALQITNTENKDTIRKLADTMMKAYEMRLNFFGEKPYVVGKMGRDMYNYMRDSIEKAVQLMRRSVREGGNESEAYLLSDLMEAMVTLNKAKKIADDVLINTFDTVSGIVDFNLKELNTRYQTGRDTAATGRSIKMWSWVEGYTTDLITPYLTCAKLTEIYTPKYKATPSDTILLSKIIGLMKRSPDCANSDFYLEVAEQNFKLKPDAEGAAALGRAFQEKKEGGKAKQYYEKAAELEKDPAQQSQYYIVLASLELQENDCSKARTYARKALDGNPNSGSAYIIIGDAYYRCAGSCQGSNKVEARYAYLAAYDKYLQAKNVDPSVASEANSRMNTAQSQFPLGEDIFFQNLKEGQSVNTGCWIGETTTLRKRPE
ncbi:MAG TPA: hypothetical protein VEC12_13385 [Bacteroidia bacterium]|nr:hypothetical protein [Bacteroidia bacterium]